MLKNKFSTKVREGPESAGPVAIATIVNPALVM